MRSRLKGLHSFKKSSESTEYVFVLSVLELNSSGEGRDRFHQSLGLLFLFFTFFRVAGKVYALKDAKDEQISSSSKVYETDEYLWLVSIFIVNSKYW